MIGIGVIGYGYWGPNLVRNFNEAPGSRLVAVSDLSTERLAVARSLHPLVKTTTDYRELLEDPAIDAVVVSTPVATHFELGMQALRAGKHLLVEKPLTASVEEAERLLEAAAARRRILMVDHTFIYTGAVQKIKEVVDAELLGRLYYFDSVRVNLGLFRSDVNVLWDLAVHDLSIMDYVLNANPTAVAATGCIHLGNTENIAYLTCYFEGDLIAHMHVNWLSPVKVRRILIGGVRQMIVFDDLEPSEKVKIYDKGAQLTSVNANGAELRKMEYRSGDMWAPRLKTTEGLQTEARHFVACIEQQMRPLTDGEAGLRVVRILEAASQSMAQRGRPVELDWQGSPALLRA
ncbi:MAG TPA: Gfo/Idh/MocA family oxidoreductase [Chloroflexota bacterium]|nr:Gfo/Idh/MocA family oxidoreductase [Chloroflexota bacterium]